LSAEHFLNEDLKEHPKVILGVDSAGLGWADLQAASEHLNKNVKIQ
jgi:hypothetical protein